MRNSLIYTVSAVMLLLFSNCEKYIDFEGDVEDPKLVVNSLINPDSTYAVHLSRSLSVIDQAELSGVNNGQVTIYDENGAIVEILQHSSDGYYNGTGTPVSGSEYTIVATAPDYTDVEATDRIPNLTTIDTWDTATIDLGIDGRELEFKFQIQDEPNVENYYVLKIYSADVIGSSIYYYNEYFHSTDPMLGLEDGESWVEEAAFTDLLFDGNNQEFTVRLEDIAPFSSFMEVRLYSCSKDYYQYRRSYSQYKETSGNPFAQPVQVFSNVANGLGIFAGYQLTRKKINF